MIELSQKTSNYRKKTIQSIFLILIISSLLVLFISIGRRNNTRSIFKKKINQFIPLVNEFEIINKIEKHSIISNPPFLNLLKIQEMNHNFREGHLKTNNMYLTIFVYGDYDMISRSILLYHKWESWLLNQFERYLKLNKGLLFLDIGANLGVYTLTAASLGNKVIAIDANINNTNRLIQSVVTNHFKSQVTVILNAISNVRKEFTMTINNANIGSQSIVDDEKAKYKVQSIYLDDLLPVIEENREIVMKIDIEQHEGYAIKKASKLFEKANIKTVLMEWMNVKVVKECLSLIDFFTIRNYKPYSDFFSKDKLQISNYTSWNTDIIWRRD